MAETPMQAAIRSTVPWERGMVIDQPEWCRIFAGRLAELRGRNADLQSKVLRITDTHIHYGPVESRLLAGALIMMVARARAGR